MIRLFLIFFLSSIVSQAQLISSSLWKNKCNKPVSPSLMSNVVLWLDASDAATITSSAGLVSQWVDKSPSARVFAQAVSGNRPELDTSGTRTSLNSIKFEGFGKFLFSASTFSLPVTHTVFFAGYWNRGPGGYSALGIQGGQNTSALQAGTNTGAVLYVSSPGSGYPDTVQTTYGGTIYTYLTSATLNGSSKFLMTSVSSSSNLSTYKIRRNKANVTPLTHAGTLPTMLIDTIGSTDNLYASSGSFGEVVAFNRTLTDCEITKVESYLKSKWGTP